jgi:hypothetical protein
MGLARISRLLALLWPFVCLAVFFLMQVGFSQLQALVLTVWIAVPLPLAYWVATRFATTSTAWSIVTGGLAVAFAGGAWLYWDAFLGPSSRTESLSGLIVLHAPIYQLVLLALALLAARISQRSNPSGA